jgi:hypothetical protein
VQVDKLQKMSKKALTKVQKSDIIIKLSRESEAKRTKSEQETPARKQGSR